MKTKRWWGLWHPLLQSSSGFKVFPLGIICTSSTYCNTDCGQPLFCFLSHFHLNFLCFELRYFCWYFVNIKVSPQVFSLPATGHLQWWKGDHLQLSPVLGEIDPETTGLPIPRIQVHLTLLLTFLSISQACISLQNPWAFFLEEHWESVISQRCSRDSQGTKLGQAPHHGFTNFPVQSSGRADTGRASPPVGSSPRTLLSARLDATHQQSWSCFLVLGSMQINQTHCPRKHLC